MAYDETTYRRDGEQLSGPAAYRAGAPTDFRPRREGDPEDTGSRIAEQFEQRRAEPDSGRDRLGVHIGWEIVLLLTVGAIAFLLYRFDPTAVQRPALDDLLITGGAIGLLTLGAGISLRAGVPNLAIGPIALAASLHYAENGDQGMVTAALPALGIAAGGGLVIALFVLMLHVPGWAATLGGALGVIVYDQLRTAPVDVQGGYDPANHAFFIFGGFALLAVFGGALGAVGGIRRLVGRIRPQGDPADRRGGIAALPLVFALVASSVFAVGAGILMAAQAEGQIAPGTGLEWTGVAIGTALFSGTSAFGRRGGIFGTLLAVVAVVLFLDYAERRDLQIALFAVAGALVGAGLMVTRLIETYGRTHSYTETDTEWNAAPTSGAAWSPELPEGFGTGTTPAPTQSRTSWDMGPWGSTGEQGRP